MVILFHPQQSAILPARMEATATCQPCAVAPGDTMGIPVRTISMSVRLEDTTVHMNGPSVSILLVVSSVAVNLAGKATELTVMVGSAKIPEEYSIIIHVHVYVYVVHPTL